MFGGMDMRKVGVALAIGGLLIVASVCLNGCTGSSGSNQNNGETTVVPSNLTPAQQALINALPPDPGEAGKQTLEGIDSDHDGVRDDVQRYIVLNHLDSAKTRAALVQLAKEIQLRIKIADTDKEAAIRLAKASDGLYCLLYVFRNDPYFANELVTRIDLQVRNTNDRFFAAAKFDSQLVGESSESFSDDQEKAKCTFNPDTMED